MHYADQVGLKNVYDKICEFRERDGEMYAPHWTRWALQEERFLALHESVALATEIQSLG